jgi:hypothetical protein
MISPWNCVTYGVGHDNKGAREYTSAAEASDRTSDNEGSRIGCSPADERTYFEERDRSDIDPFDREEGVEFAEKELGGGRRLVGRKSPA